MFQNTSIMIGQYRPIESFMHNLDARVKLLPMLLLLVLILFTSSISFYLTMFILVIALLYYAGVDTEILKENYKPILFIIAFTSGYHLIFSGHDTKILFSIYNLSLYKGAVSSALYYSLRLLLFLFSAFLITLTCSPSELSEAITKLLKPLKIFHFPLSDFSLILFISLRFIPIIYEEFHNVKNAQKMRGVNFSGSFITKILNFKSLIIPLLVSAIRRADYLTDALVVRGYDSKKERTFYTTQNFTIIDIIFLTVSLSCILLLFYFIG